jgi:predicted transcriptional regulator
MSEFSAEELFDTIDRNVLDLLTRQRQSEPPVDAIALVRSEFGYAIRHEDEDDTEPRRYGDRPRRRPRNRELVFLPNHSDTAQQSLAARACAKELIPTILGQLGVVPGTEQKSAHGQLVGLIAPRLVLPTCWFATAARKANHDLLRLRETFDSVAYEWIGLRLLDLEDPCVISVVDDGSVTTRRSNFAQLGKKLTPAEQTCVEKVQSSEDPQTVRRDGWSARGWPIPTGPFNRIILRAVPDDL